MLEAVPLTVAMGNRVVANIHRHHGPLPSGYGQVVIGAVVDSRLCGVAMSGRPTNRNSDDGQTIEVLRLATDGTRNAASFLLGASAKAGKVMGAWRIITYTLDSETGISLKAAGWTLEKEGIVSKWTLPGYGRSVKPRPHYEETKRRWVRYFRDGPVPLDDMTLTEPVVSLSQLSLLDINDA